MNHTNNELIQGGSEIKITDIIGYKEICISAESFEIKRKFEKIENM